MANYAVNDYIFEDESIQTVMGALETQLEALDSTSNPVRLLTVVYNEKNGKFVGCLIADGS